MIAHRHHAFLPALPALFVETVKCASKWYAELVELRAKYEPLVEEHDTTGDVPLLQCIYSFCWSCEVVAVYLWWM